MVDRLMNLRTADWTKTAYVSVLMIASLLFSACQRENCEPPEKINRIDPRIENTPAEYSMTFDGNMLVFNSVEGYQRAIELDFVNGNEDESHTAVKKRVFQEMLKNYGFQNYFSSRSNSEEVLMDDWLGQFLNPDGVIQIADHVYKVDLEKEKVYVLNAQYKESDYNALIHGAVSEHVMEYSVDDDVIDEITDRSPEAQVLRKSCGGIGGGTYVSASTSSGPIIKTFSDGRVWRLESYVKMFRAGIYYRLSSGHKIWGFPHKSSSGAAGYLITNSALQNDLDVVWIKQQIKGPQAWWRRRPCNKNTTRTRSAGIFYTNNKAQHQANVYLGIRNLNGYYLFVRSNAYYSDGSDKAFTNYAGRNINSPY